MDTISYESYRWRLTPLVLPEAKEYLRAINNISFADIVLISAWNSNTFFKEACQMLANSINLYQQGFFDAAFYSLRQSIELSIGTLYLNAKPDDMERWVRQEDGFEVGRMSKYLKENEIVFKDVREKMSDYFNYVLEQRKKIDKYVHKQGFKTFYTTYRCSSSNGREEKFRRIVKKDFVRMLKVSIGAVAVYRLIIDPLPVLLNEEEIITRSPDFLTEPYTDSFIETYIGVDVLNCYKQTDIYKSYKADLLSREKQNEAVFNVIHYQHFDHSNLKDITNQIHLLSLQDRIAFIMFSGSCKISQVVVDGYLLYTSDVEPNDKEMICNQKEYDELFSVGTDFNIFHNGGYLSRILIDDKYTYLMHNEEFVSEEIQGINDITALLTEKVQEQKIYWEEVMESSKGSLDNTKFLLVP